MPKLTRKLKFKTIASIPEKETDFFVHPTVLLEENVTIEKGTKIWHYSQIRKNTHIGRNCVIGNSVFIDFESIIGDNVKIQNRAIIYHQAIIENGVFIGPNVCFTNDKIPRAINPDGSLKSADDWEVSTIRIGEGASIGGHSVLTPGVSVGKFALIGSGSVVTKNVPDFALVYGNPARIHGFVCRCGAKIKDYQEQKSRLIGKCKCGLKVIISQQAYRLWQARTESKKEQTKIDKVLEFLKRRWQEGKKCL